VAAREGCGDSNVSGWWHALCQVKLIRLINASRTTTKVSRLAEYLETLDAPRLTDDEIALIDEAGAKEHHRWFVRGIPLMLDSIT
jgi:hypothetical protein